MNYLGYENKRVIVSGCFSGMGEATARLLLELGAEVHGLDYKETTLNLASFTQVDLRDPATIDAAVAGIGGRVDALFNCAGLPQTAPAIDVMKVNYAGARHLTDRVLELMEEGGAVATISSTAGMGWSRRLPQLMEFVQLGNFEDIVQWCESNADTVHEGYTLSKEALIVWTMATSSQLIQRGIRINCTLPAPTQTPMMDHFESRTAAEVLDTFIQPMNRRATPEEQAGPLVFLNSAAASYVNGPAMAVDGGFMSGVATGRIDLSALAPSS
jgi:NAD(P)-dependent dehydrogenase (short-subunit alcohol dehydrogenase family)